MSYTDVIVHKFTASSQLLFNRIHWRADQLLLKGLLIVCMSLMVSWWLHWLAQGVVFFLTLFQSHLTQIFLPVACGSQVQFFKMMKYISVTGNNFHSNSQLSVRWLRKVICKCLCVSECDYFCWVHVFLVADGLTCSSRTSNMAVEAATSRRKHHLEQALWKSWIISQLMPSLLLVHSSVIRVV